MFKGSVNKLATISFMYSTLTCTIAAPAPADTANTAASTAITSVAGVYSKLSAAQLKHHVHSRLYLNQDIGRSIDRDPLFPGRSWPSYSFIGYEYFPSAKLSYGLVVPYVYEKFVYNKYRGNTIAQVFGFLPYISYLASPSWLYTAELGAFVEGYNERSFDNNNIPVFRLRRQVFTHQAGAYATWIGPYQKYTATLRGGVIYSNSRFRSAIDNFNDFYPTRHFETGTASVSTRLKYLPDSDFWNAFLHVQADYRFSATARPDVYKQYSFIQNRFFQFGPGMHIYFNDTWEMRLMYLYSLRFGYTKENRIGVRLRAAF